MEICGCGSVFSVPDVKIFMEQFKRVLGAVDAANIRVDAVEKRIVKLEERPSETPECV